MLWRTSEGYMMRPSCTRKELFRTPYLPAESERKPRDRQALIFRCRTQATRLAPASTTPALTIPMMTPAKTSKGKWTPRYTRERTTMTPASTNAGANGGVGGGGRLGDGGAPP